MANNDNEPMVKFAITGSLAVSVLGLVIIFIDLPSCLEWLDDLGLPILFLGLSVTFFTIAAKTSNSDVKLICVVFALGFLIGLGILTYNKISDKQNTDSQQGKTEASQTTPTPSPHLTP